MSADKLPSDGRRVRRIIVALDTQSGNTAALEQAAALAARLQGEVVALYVEDIDLVRLAEHPTVSLFSTGATASREVGAGLLRESMRLQASRLRRNLERAASRRQVKYVFEVRQGRLLAEVMSAAVDDDLVILRWSGSERAAPWMMGPPPSAIAQAVATARVRSVLLLHPQGATNGPVLIAFDGGEASRHAVQVGAQIADREGGEFEVVLLAGRPEQAEAWSREIRVAVGSSRLALSFLHVPKADLDMLTGIAARQRSALLVLSADLALSTADSTRQLRRLTCSLLLVR